MKKWFIFLCLLVLCPQIAWGQTFQITPDETGMSLTEALAQCEDGDIIELVNGTYNESNENFPLTVTKAVTICAAEGSSPVIEAPAFLAAIRVEADGVTLQGLDIQMRRTGIYAIGDDLTVENCRISLANEEWRTSSCGIWGGGVYRMTVQNCSFTGCGISLAGPPLSDSSVGKPVLTGLFEVGEDVGYFTSHTIEECTVNGKPLFYEVSKEYVCVPEGVGEIICCDCEEVWIQNAEISDCSMGMVLTYNKQVIIEDSRADRCGVFGIYIAKCDGGVLRRCVSTETNHGLDLRASQNFALMDCSAADCDQGLFFSAMTNSVMTNCTVTGTGQGYFMAAGSGNTIYQCEALECENGFNLQKEGSVLMTDCLIQDCSVCGVRLDWTPTVFSGNRLYGNWTGVMAYGDVSFEIVDNDFENSLSCGLYLKDIAYSRFCGNTFTDTVGECVEALGNLSGSIWNGNNLDKIIKSDEEMDFHPVF